MNDSKIIGTGTAIVLTLLILLLIGWLIGLFQPKCAMSGCDNDAADGSKYCYLHELSNHYYGNPDYNAVYEQSRKKAKTSGENNSSLFGLTNSGTSVKSYGSKASAKNRHSGFSSDSYNEGYDEVYGDGEPDWERYDEDDDYARGADDAMDEYDEYGEDW